MICDKISVDNLLVRYEKYAFIHRSHMYTNRLDEESFFFFLYDT